MAPPELIHSILAEINAIPPARLVVLADLIHHYRLGVQAGEGKRTSAQADMTLAKVQTLAGSCTLVVCGDVVAEHQARIRLSLRRIGQQIPVNDLWIAACAMVRNAALATRGSSRGRRPWHVPFARV